MCRRAPVELGEGSEALGQAADDRERHRQPEQAGARGRLGIPTDGDPDGQALLQRPRVDGEAVQRRAMLARPRDALRFPQLEQQLQLLGEQVVVVVEVVAEEREGLDERAAADHDLGPAFAEQVHRGELLEDPDGVVRAEHVHRARQPNPPGAHGGRAEDDSRRRDREVRAMMLADPEDVEPDLVGELDLLDQVAQPLGR